LYQFLGKIGATDIASLTSKAAANSLQKKQQEEEEVVVMVERDTTMTVPFSTDLIGGIWLIQWSYTQPPWLWSIMLLSISYLYSSYLYRNWHSCCTEREDDWVAEEFQEAGGEGSGPWARESLPSRSSQSQKWEGGHGDDVHGR
jgi:hypothetical protein